MIRVGILGATGYTAAELIAILLRHPDVEITVLTSRQEGRPHIASIHPQLVGRLNLHLEDIQPAAVAAQSDCVFSCLPHAASAALVKEVLDDSTRVVDFSADYRLGDLDTYHQWYGGTHPDPDRVGKVTYGLPELFGSELPDARLVANPGCNPTAPILALAPLLKKRMIEPRDIIVDAKCGVSGAGRNPKLTTHFPECNESVSAYNVGHHRHTPEFSHVLKKATGQQVELMFVPHLVPMDRGILTTTYVRPTATFTDEQVLDTLREFYAEMPFMRIVEHLPATKDTVGTNFCDITARTVGDRIVLIGSVDNLLKGASGAAVQNFNLMYGFPETTAL